MRWSFLVVMLLGAELVCATPATPEDTDTGLTAVFVRYYSAIAKGRWNEAFQMLHGRLKLATEVQTPEDLARRDVRTQQELIEAFEAYDRLDVARTEVDLTSIKAHVTGSAEGNVAGEVSYDLVVFPKGPGRPLMYRVRMDVGLDHGQIIRITQQSMARIDPGGYGDAT